MLALEKSNVTHHAFAIDNFNRPSDEVAGVLELPRVKLTRAKRQGQYFGPFMLLQLSHAYSATKP